MVQFYLKDFKKANSPNVPTSVVIGQQSYPLMSLISSLSFHFCPVNTAVSKSLTRDPDIATVNYPINVSKSDAWRPTNMSVSSASATE